MTLTGNTRHRAGRESWISTTLGRYTNPVLVLQVEYHNTGNETSPSLTLWRDAHVEDLAELERIKGFGCSMTPSRR